MAGSPGGRSPNWLSRLVHSDRGSDDETTTQGAKARRREQVRRAQRVHRDRKATYVKSLEFEVARLRARDVAHDEEIKKFKHTLRILRDLLNSNNVQIPAGLPAYQLNSPLAMIEVSGASDDPTIRAHMPVFDAAAPYPFEREATGSATMQPDVSDQQPLPILEPMLVDIPTPVHHPYGLDTSQVGVDFVLALEHPCLWHAQNPSPMLEPNSGTGHQLMLISPILAKSPRRQGLKAGVSPKHGVLATGTKWSVPAVELEKLLSYSEGLDLDGELTPVQAWQRVRHHPRFIDLTPTGLETLRASLLTVVQCYGFGAVIDEAYFEEMLNQTFGQS